MIQFARESLRRKCLLRLVSAAALGGAALIASNAHAQSKYVQTEAVGCYADIYSDPTSGWCDSSTANYIPSVVEANAFLSSGSTGSYRGLFYGSPSYWTLANHWWNSSVESTDLYDPRLHCRCERRLRLHGFREQRRLYGFCGHRNWPLDFTWRLRRHAWPEQF